MGGEVVAEFGETLDTGESTCIIVVAEVIANALEQEGWDRSVGDFFLLIEEQGGSESLCVRHRASRKA